MTSSLKNSIRHMDVQYNNTTQCSAVQYSTTQQHYGTSGVGWGGVEWSGVVWCGVEWSGVVWCGVELCGVEWSGAEQSRAEQMVSAPISAEGNVQPWVVDKRFVSHENNVCPRICFCLGTDSLWTFFPRHWQNTRCCLDTCFMADMSRDNCASKDKKMIPQCMC